MPSFASALDRSMETIKRPPPPPLGSYVAIVTKMPDPAESFSGKDGTTYERITIQMKILSALDDVDPYELADFGQINGVPLRMNFLFNTSDENRFEQTLNGLKDFLSKCGVDGDSGVLGERLSELPNCQVGVTIEHRADPKDPMILYPEISRTFAL